MIEDNIDRSLSQTDAYYKMSKAFEWDKWIKEIPSISLKSGWKIKVVPPFGGAIVRFSIIKGKAHVSVYLDCYNQIGYMNEPYWEIYPDGYGDCKRFLMNEVDELTNGIHNSIKCQNRNLRWNKWMEWMRLLVQRL